jgi:hypothetical protein
VAAVLVIIAAVRSDKQVEMLAAKNDDVVAEGSCDTHLSYGQRICGRGGTDTDGETCRQLRQEPELVGSMLPIRDVPGYRRARALPSDWQVGVFRTRVVTTPAGWRLATPPQALSRNSFAAQTVPFAC